MIKIVFPSVSLYTFGNREIAIQRENNRIWKYRNSTENK